MHVVLMYFSHNMTWNILIFTFIVSKEWDSFLWNKIEFYVCVFTTIIMILIIIFVIIRAYQRSARFQVHWIVHVIVQKEVDYIDREFFKTSVVSTKTKQKWLYRLATFLFFWKAKKAIIIHTRIQPFKSNCSWTVH